MSLSICLCFSLTCRPHLLEDLQRLRFPRRTHEDLHTDYECWKDAAWRSWSQNHRRGIGSSRVRSFDLHSCFDSSFFFASFFPSHCLPCVFYLSHLWIMFVLFFFLNHFLTFVLLDASWSWMISIKEIDWNIFNERSREPPGAGCGFCVWNGSARHFCCVHHHVAHLDQ